MIMNIAPLAVTVDGTGAAAAGPGRGRWSKLPGKFHPLEEQKSPQHHWRRHLLGTTPENVELAPLGLHPRCQLRVAVVVGDVGMAVLSGKGRELVVATVPNRVVRVPHEAEILQNGNSLVGEKGRPSLLQEFVLVPLPLDPRGEGGELLVVARNSTVAVNLREDAQLFVPVGPLFGLVLTESQLGRVMLSIV